MKRRKYTKEFKQNIMKEAEVVGNITVVARKHNLNPSMVSRWIREANKKPRKVDLSTDLIIKSKEYKELESNKTEVEQENTQLKVILGEKDLEIQILRDLLKKKNLL